MAGERATWQATAIAHDKRNNVDRSDQLPDGRLLGSWPRTRFVVGHLDAWSCDRKLIHYWSFSKALDTCLTGAFEASHAASVANFSSCDHGAPRERPSSVARRINSFGLTRNTCPARSRSSFSLIVKSCSPQRLLSWRSASRKSSPSAV